MRRAIAVYLCGDELPSALFPYLSEDDFPGDKESAMKKAEEWPVHQPHWMDKTIKDISLDGSLQR